MHTVFALWSFLPDVQRRGTFPLGLAIFLGIVAIVGVGLLYAREAGRLNFLTRSIMATVRMLIIGIVVFLLMRPVWVRDLREEKIRPVGVLIDVSKSMEMRDPRPNTADQRAPWRTAKPIRQRACRANNRVVAVEFTQ